MPRTSEDEEHGYTCGQCGEFQYAVVGEEAPVPCVHCGWVHRERKKYTVPNVVKLDLTQY